MKDAIDKLLSVNILKYNAKGGLNWHGFRRKRLEDLELKSNHNELNNNI